MNKWVKVAIIVVLAVIIVSHVYQTTAIFATSQAPIA